MKKTELTTYCGHTIDLNKGPEIEQIEIRDIAHGLSMQCRYAGHIDRFYSVAEHSVYVAMLAPKKYQLYFLLHDAHEYLYQDIVKPLKNTLFENNCLYSHLISGLDSKLMDKFGLSRDVFQFLAPDIKKADKYIQEIEVQILKQGISPDLIFFHGDKLVDEEFGLSPTKARDQFLSFWASLGMPLF